MKYIVSEALKHAKRSEQQDTESTECDEFGPLEIAVVGCGEEALTWVDMAAVRQIFDTGDSTVLYWGTGTRQKPPEDLLQNAISNRSAGCDVATVDRGLSLVRFGAPFTLAEFKNLRDYIETRYQSPSARQACWQTAGFVTQGFDDQCRVVLLLTGIELESFTFIQNI